MRISIIVFWLFISIVSVQGQESSNEKCNKEVILEMYRNIESVSEDLMLRFLKTFGQECKNNAEFGQYSNAALFDVIQHQPELFCKVLNSNAGDIDVETIIFGIENPVHDLIDLDHTKKRIVETNIENKTTDKIINALNIAIGKFE